MNEQPEERKMASIVGMIIWRWGIGIAAIVAAYGAMWVRINAPSMAQFERLTSEVQGLREDIIRGERVRDGVDELKKRQDRLDERMLELERRSTPRKTTP